ncbi:MAG: DUF420 domain-containing protein [Planctomycetaceae bacterium]|nr:DUF420 domain-containing protein [Planctomycetaceae bacterium]
MEKGFLGYDSSLMLDVVVCALVLVVPVLVYSISLAKFSKKFGLHKAIQLGLGVALLLTVALFEIDIRMHGGWQNIVNKDPASPRVSPEQLQLISQSLTVHLVFAISTPVLWIWTTVEALRRFPDPTAPSAYSRRHKTLAWLTTVDLVLTSATGLLFYYLAFIAA